MPSGRVHNLINIAVYAGLSTAALLATRAGAIVVTPPEMLNFTLGFMAGTFLLSPDLDLATGHVDSKRRWGVLGFLWVPYGRMFSHRGLSHTWLLGPLTRVVYLAVVAALVIGVLRVCLPQLPWPRLLGPFDFHLLVPLFAGYYLSQWLHLVADGVRPDHGLRYSAKKANRAYKKARPRRRA